MDVLLTILNYNIFKFPKIFTTSFLKITKVAFYFISSGIKLGGGGERAGGIKIGPSKCCPSSLR